MSDDGYLGDFTEHLPCDQRCDIPAGMAVQVFNEPKSFCIACPNNDCELRLRAYPVGRQA